MCHEHKLACHSWYWHLVNSCPALTVNIIWFTDDKLLKFYYCSHKKSPKRSLSHTCGNSLILTSSSKTVHQQTPLARWLSFWIASHLFSCPYVAKCWYNEHFLLVNQTQFTIEAELQLTARVFNRPQFSGRHDFQAKKIWTSVYKIWKSCSRPTRKIKQNLNAK